MNSLDNLYEQYHILAENLLDMGNSDFTTDLMQYGVTRNYYERINGATESLCEFYDKYLQNDSIRDAVSDRLQDKRSENVKFCLLIDVLRCYDGLDHPTSFTTPEGVALMILLGKVLGIGKINRYEKLEDVNSATLSLIDLIPYISDCSDELGKKYSLFMSPILVHVMPDIERDYRIILYSLCKRIAEVDGEISLSEKEWLNEISLLNDDDPDNDIDVNGL